MELCGVGDEAPQFVFNEPSDGSQKPPYRWRHPPGAIAKEQLMTSMAKSVSRTAVVVCVTTMLLSGAVTPSLAVSNDGVALY
jgi:hypothetical protein